MAFSFKISPHMGDKIKLYFDKEALGSRAYKEIDFDKSHLEIDLKDADVVWVQYLKGHYHDDPTVVVEGGVIVI